MNKFKHRVTKARNTEISGRFSAVMKTKIPRKDQGATRRKTDLIIGIKMK